MYMTHCIDRYLNCYVTEILQGINGNGRSSPWNSSQALSGYMPPSALASNPPNTSAAASPIAGMNPRSLAAYGGPHGQGAGRGAGLEGRHNSASDNDTPTGSISENNVRIEGERLRSFYYERCRYQHRTALLL